jgi:hypothetical protein
MVEERTYEAGVTSVFFLSNPELCGDKICKVY